MSSKSPEIRFDGFTDDWEQRKFTDIMYRVRTSSNSNKLPKVEFEDITSGEGRLNKDVSHKFDTRKGTLFKPNNILFGKLRPYLKNWLLPDFEGIALGDFWVFESKNSDAHFNYFLIQAARYQKVANDTSGTKMPRSDWKQVSTTLFSIPSFEEQIKIGSFLKQIEKTIALHQRELDNLLKSKKGFLQKMFPKRGEMIPELRFSEYSNEWNSIKLGKIGTTYSGLSGKTKEDFGHGEAEFVTYKNVFSNAITNINETENVEIDEKQNRVQYGDVFFTTSSETPEEVGMSSVWLENKDNTYLNSFCFGFRPTDNVNYLYLAYLLRSSEVRKQFINLAQGISRYNISKKKTMDIILMIPNIEEQEKIGTFFKQLDDKIDNKQQHIENLKQTKKAFLQKMFV